MAALAPGCEPRQLESLEAVSAGVAWSEHADPLVRARVEAAAALFPRSRLLAFPEPQGTLPVFMREIADIHRDLFAEYGELYGENIRPKIERCSTNHMITDTTPRITNGMGRPRSLPLASQANVSKP